jgi:hypothetical protein
MQRHIKNRVNTFDYVEILYKMNIIVNKDIFTIPALVRR